MEDNKDIANLQESDFISFLYLERDRENNLSEFHGWNNWALAGAIITAICSGYAVLGINPSLDMAKVLYNASCSIAFFSHVILGQQSSDENGLLTSLRLE